MDAGSDDTRAKRKQFGVFLCLPMALVLLLIWNGDFGMSPIYGHHGARRYAPVNRHVGSRTFIPMGECLFLVPAPPDGQITFANGGHQDAKELIADVLRRLNIGV